MNYTEAFLMGMQKLKEAEIGEAQLDARLLLEEVCGTDHNTLLCHGDREVSEAEEEQYRKALEQRAVHVPLQHLLGYQDFMGLRFQVNEHVLIPRQDTEILVEEAMRYLHDGMRILDLCTGSGCILLSLLHYSNDCEGTGVDISKEALQVAALNAELLGIKADFLKSDLYEKVTGKFDLLVSNPPYIERKVIPTLMEEVREYDPYIALDGGEDGLDFYRRIIGGAQDYLKRGGQILMEIGSGQAQAVSELLREAGFKEIDVCRDFAGLDRVVSGRLPIL
ncbi:MAG TPA: peptide chain release factor N(5)-glutamine methyltransferase [Lachnospiraceae bacterium]|jgi:protein-(glutamine-N5) methyltransferase, release factor-specific|nr:peptide chain release factor N(5)-glutamine methyltransferase [Lachnospiraceae bacterium]